jgi:hypothetical protein
MAEMVGHTALRTSWKPRLSMGFDIIQNLFQASWLQYDLLKWYDDMSSYYFYGEYLCPRHSD